MRALADNTDYLLVSVKWGTNVFGNANSGSEDDDVLKQLKVKRWTKGVATNKILNIPLKLMDFVFQETRSTASTQSSSATSTNHNQGNNRVLWWWCHKSNTCTENPISPAENEIENNNQVQQQSSVLRKYIKEEVWNKVRKFRSMERDHERKKNEEWAQSEIEEFIRYSI